VHADRRDSGDGSACRRGSGAEELVTALRRRESLRAPCVGGRATTADQGTDGERSRIGNPRNKEIAQRDRSARGFSALSERYECIRPPQGCEFAGTAGG